MEKMAKAKMALVKMADLKRRTELFSQYTVHWAAPYAAF